MTFPVLIYYAWSTGNCEELQAPGSLQAPSEGPASLLNSLDLYTLLSPQLSALGSWLIWTISVVPCSLSLGWLRWGVLNPQAHTSPRPDRDWAAQQKVNGGWRSKASFAILAWLPTAALLLNHSLSPSSVFHKTGPWCPKGWGLLVRSGLEVVAGPYCFQPQGTVLVLWA